MMRTAACSLFVLMSTCAAAVAATATPEEAQRLTSVFQSYLGSDPGVVSVTPSGEFYSARIDLGPLLAKIRQPGFSASLTPLEWTLSDQGSGKWKVDQKQSLSITVKVEGQFDLKASVGSINGTGLFDEALGAFASGATDITQVGLQEIMTSSGTTTKVDYTIATMHYETAMAGTGDSADGTVKSTFTDLHETISTSADGSTPPMDFSISAPSGTQDASVKGLKPRAVNALIAWLVAHPSKETIVAGQAELKDKLRAAMPVFGNASTVASIADMSINTMLGKFGIGKVGVLIDMNGIVENGALREKFTLTGLQPPPGIVPPWAAGLTPTDLAIDFNLSDFNLAAPAALIIDNLDLSKDPPLPKDMEPRLLQAVMPKGSVMLALGPSGALAKLFDLKLEGSMTAGPSAMPQGQALVKLKGIDEIMAAIQAAPPEMGMQQAAPMVVVAKGLGKQEPDGYLSWKIESTPQGGVTVNGVDPMKMGGQ